jgi:hypothetical protein
MPRYYQLRLVKSGSSRFPDVLHQFKHLARLRKLHLDIRLDKYSMASSFQLGEDPSGTRMTATELECWIRLCAALPSITELALISGFTWFDAMEGFAEVDSMPSIHKLALNLTSFKPSSSTARRFNHVFSGLFGITFSTEWCPTPAWIHLAFAHRRLENIIIHDIFSLRARLYYHDCSGQHCNWATSMAALIELNATSLTTLNISSTLSPAISLDQTRLPSLTTLILKGAHFLDDASFENFMQPFLRSPLQHLSIDNCVRVPENFAPGSSQARVGGPISRPSRLWEFGRNAALATLYGITQTLMRGIVGID